jgi:hypothetical protein
MTKVIINKTEYDVDEHGDIGDVSIPDPAVWMCRASDLQEGQRVVICKGTGTRAAVGIITIQPPDCEPKASPAYYFLTNSDYYRGGRPKDMKGYKSSWCLGGEGSHICYIYPLKDESVYDGFSSLIASRVLIMGAFYVK